MDWNKKWRKNVRFTKELMGCQTALMNAAGWWRSWDRRWFYTSPFPFFRWRLKLVVRLELQNSALYICGCLLVIYYIYTVVAEIIEPWWGKQNGGEKNCTQNVLNLCMYNNYVKLFYIYKNYRIIIITLKTLLAGNNIAYL